MTTTLTLRLLTSLCLISAAVTSTTCPLSSPNCSECEAFNGNYELFCPSHFRTEFRVHYQPGELIIIFEDRYDEESSERVLKSLEGLVVEHTEFIRMENAPLLASSGAYKRIFDAMNITDQIKHFVLAYAKAIDGKLEANVFDGLENLIALDIEENPDYPITEVSELAFQGLDRLKAMTFLALDLESIPSKIFNPLTSMLKLRFIVPSLGELPSEVFASQENLQTLRLDTKSVNRYPNGLFSKTVDLEVLEMIGRDVQDLSAELFVHAHKLENVTVKGTGFENAPVGIFDNTSLARFNYYYTCPKAECNVDFDSAFLKNLDTLKYFRFGRNYRTKLTFADDFFNGCIGLAEVHLDRTGLQSVPESLFRGSTNLRSLKLGGNDLEVVNGANADAIEAAITKYVKA